MNQEVNTCEWECECEWMSKLVRLALPIPIPSSHRLPVWKNKILNVFFPCSQRTLLWSSRRHSVEMVYELSCINKVCEESSGIHNKNPFSNIPLLWIPRLEICVESCLMGSLCSFPAQDWVAEEHDGHWRWPQVQTDQQPGSVFSGDPQALQLRRRSVHLQG